MYVNYLRIGQTNREIMKDSVWKERVVYDNLMSHGWREKDELSENSKEVKLPGKMDEKR